MEGKEAAAEAEDIFGWIIKHCQPTSSQEEKLRTCSFARESETFPECCSRDPRDASLASHSHHHHPHENLGIQVDSFRDNLGGRLTRGHQIEVLDSEFHQDRLLPKRIRVSWEISESKRQRAQAQVTDLDSPDYGGRKDESLCQNCKGVIGVSRRVEKLRRDGQRACGVIEEENTCKNARGINAISGGDRLSKNGDEGGRLRKDNLSRSGNCGDGKACQVENLQQGNGARGLHKATKVIEEFRYVRSGDGMDARGEETGGLGKRKLPLSMTAGQGKGGWTEVETDNSSRNPGMKAGFLMSILEVSKSLVKEVDDSSDGDFLQTAKKRGIIFPRPRWWPPGFDG